MDALVETDLALPAVRGKVRDVYELGTDRILLVATDRLSAFDVVLPTPVPGKGRLLTEIAAFWLRWAESRGICRTHLVSTDADDIPDNAFTPGGTPRAALRGRVTIGRRLRVLPVECVVRGYLEGSGWAEYAERGTACGVRLPPGLRRCERLPEPIFTPATKAEHGEHDENIDEPAARALLGDARFDELRRVSLTLYAAAAEHAARRGIIIADTKFEFGVPVDRPDAEAVLADEALTPDSSRFWPADEYAPGRPQRSYDKQFVREYLEGLVAEKTWDKRAPGPTLPEPVVLGTLERYREARDRLLGDAL
ncbi:MAG: phosphoribosylaminoimidazolesuccinocarboxamide synthase [Phycisphaerales bacterium]